MTTEWLVFCHCGIILRTSDRKKALEAQKEHRKSNCGGFVQFRQIERNY